MCCMSHIRMRHGEASLDASAVKTLCIKQIAFVRRDEEMRGIMGGHIKGRDTDFGTAWMHGIRE